MVTIYRREIILIILTLRDAPAGLTLNNCTLCPHCIYVFCIYLRTNRDLWHLRHKLIGFYNRDEKCLQRGTDWGFKYSSLRFVFKSLIMSFRESEGEVHITTYFWRFGKMEKWKRNVKLDKEYCVLRIQLNTTIFHLLIQ